MDTIVHQDEGLGLRTPVDDSRSMNVDSFHDRVQAFLQLKHIAVVGISRKSGAANSIFDKFISSGFQVTPIHPVLDSYSGVKCYRRISDMPVAPDGVFLMTCLELTLEITRDCIQAGVSFIWMHNMNGTHPRWAKGMASKAGSVHTEAVELAEEAGIKVIAGSCPMQYLKPVDPFHRCIRWINEKTGSV